MTFLSGSDSLFCSNFSINKSTSAGSIFGILSASAMLFHYTFGGTFKALPILYHIQPFIVSNFLRCTNRARNHALLPQGYNGQYLPKLVPLEVGLQISRRFRPQISPQGALWGNSQAAWPDLARTGQAERMPDH